MGTKVVAAAAAQAPVQAAWLEAGVGDTSQHFVTQASHTDMEVLPPAGHSLRDQFEAYLPAAGTNFTNVEAEFPQGSESRVVHESPLASDPRLPAGFQILTPATSSSLWPLRIRCETDGSEMVLISAGVFQQGTDAGPTNCRPAHPKYVSSFYIDVTEVTLEQFTRFQQRQKDAKRGTLPKPANADGRPGDPVLGMSWKDAELYAQQIGKALPTEAEWEKAARGTSGSTYPWGEGRPAWNAPRQPSQIDTVATFRADCSPFGVFDMAGNAREWCSDWYSGDAYVNAREKDGSPLRDSPGPQRAEIVGHKVVKGGTSSWELWQRNHAPMRESFPDIGFRCVLRIPAGSIQSAPAPAATEPRPSSNTPQPTRPSNPVPRPRTGF